MNKLLHFFQKFILALVFILLIFMGLTTIGQLDNINQTLFLTKIIQILFLVSVFLGLASLINHSKINTKFYVFGLLLISIGIRLVFIYKINPEQVSDFLFMYKHALEIAKENPNALKTEYYNFAIYNTPFTIYQGYLLKWFNSIILLKILSVIYSTLIVYFLYKISQTIAGEKTARIAGLLAALFPPFIIYNSILTNQTISILFLLIGIYFLLNRKYINSGLMIGLGQIFRPIGILILLCAFFYIAWKWIKSEDRFSINKIKSSSIIALKLSIPYYLILLSTSYLLTTLNFTDHGLTHNPTPSYKFLVGLNLETQGSYSEEDNRLIYTNLDDFESIAKQQINERTSNLNEVAFLIERKFEKMWTNVDTAFYWINMEIEPWMVFTQYYWIIILLSGGSLIFYMKSNEPLFNSPQILFVSITLLAFIGIYLLIEIQPRYRYELYPLFIILSAIGINKQLNTIRIKLINNKIITFGLIISILFSITLIPKTFYQRSFEQKLTGIDEYQKIDFQKKLNDEVSFQSLYLKNLNDSITSLIIELNPKTKASTINKYALTIRGGTIDENKKEILWDFKPVLYKDDNRRYLKTTIKNSPDSIEYLSFALYDRNGFKGFKSKFVKLKNLKIREKN